MAQIRNIFTNVLFRLIHSGRRDANTSWGPNRSSQHVGLDQAADEQTALDKKTASLRPSAAW